MPNNVPFNGITTPAFQKTVQRLLKKKSYFMLGNLYDQIITVLFTFDNYTVRDSFRKVLQFYKIS